MADNVSLSPGSGCGTIATDDDGIAQHQYVQIEFGGDGVFSKVAAGTPLPVGDDGGSLTVDGTVAATQSGTWTVGLSTGVNNIGDVDVLTLPAIPAGTNNIGDVDVLTLPAIPAGNNNIGDVDVVSVPGDPFGANADAASATGSISAKLRFIAATGVPVTNTPGVVQSGTWTVQPGNTANTTPWLVDPRGNVAHDGADSGNPVKVGAKAETSPKGITLVADGDRTDLYADADGIQMVKLATSNADLLS